MFGNNKNAKTRFLSLLPLLLSPALAVSSALAETELAAIEESVNKQEARFSDIVEGAEKRFQWYQGIKQRTEYVVVYLHGFSASNREISPVTELFANKLRANAFFARLRGHGRDGEAMLDGAVDAWKQDTLEAYEIAKSLGDKIILVGTSTGATLSTWLAAQTDKDDLHAAIIVSPNFALANKSAQIMQWPGGVWLAKKIRGEYGGFTPQNEYHGKYWTSRYPLEALLPMLDLVDEVSEIDKSKISIPHMMFYSPNDSVIDVDAAKKTLSEMTNAYTKPVPYLDSKELSQHVLFGFDASEQENDRVADMMTAFIEELE